MMIQLLASATIVGSPYQQHLAAEHVGVEAPRPADIGGDDEVREHDSFAGPGTRPSLALHQRADFDGPAHPGDGDPRREHDRRVEVWRVVDVVAVDLGPSLDGGTLGDLGLPAVHADGRRRVRGLELVAIQDA